MKKTLAIIITVLSAILALAYWNEPAGYAWICAVAGWIDKCFEG